MENYSSERAEGKARCFFCSTGIFAMLFCCLARMQGAQSGEVEDTFKPPINGGMVRTVLPAEAGKLFIGGSFESVGNPAVPGTKGVAKLNRDGSVDRNFAAQVGLVVPASAYWDGGSIRVGGVYALVLQPDGRLLVGGAFTNVDQAPRNGK